MQLVIAGLPFTTAQEHQPETEVEGAEEHNPILPETDELIFGSLAFLLVFWVLARRAFPRLNEALKNREDKIRGDLEGAERARQEAEAELKRYEEQLREARGESGRIIEEARRTAESMRRDLMAKAEDESRQVVARAQEEIRAERDRAVQELRRELAEASVDLAGRVVGETLDRDRQLRLVEGYIEDLAAMGGGNGSGPGSPRREGGGEEDHG